MAATNGYTGQVPKAQGPRPRGRGAVGSGSWPSLGALRVLDLLCALALAAALSAGCALEHAPAPAPSYDVEGVPLSDDLRPYLEAARTSLSVADPATPAADDVAAFHDLVLRIQRPESREAAGDELYRRWEADPANALWVELAGRYENLLGRTDDFAAMLAHPLLGDTTTALGVFARGRPGSDYGAQGGRLLQAWRTAAPADTLQQIVIGLKVARTLSDNGGSLDAVRLLLSMTSGARRLAGAGLEMLLWYDIAKFLVREDRLDDGLHAITAALDMAVKRGNRRWEIRNKVRLASVLTARREYEPALDLLAACGRESQEHDFPWLHADSMARAAALCSERGMAERALFFDRQSLRRSLQARDSLNVPRGLMNIADDHRLLGNLDSCLVYHREARRWVEAYPNPGNRLRLPILEAELYCQLGDYEKAEALLAEARALARPGTPGIDEARLHLILVKQGLEMGTPALAYRSIDRLAELERTLHDWRPDENLKADYEIATADFLKAHGEVRRAADALARAAATSAARPGGDKEWELHRCAGELALQRGDLSTAYREFERCSELAEETCNAEQRAQSLFQMGRLFLEQGRFEEAHRLFKRVDADRAFGGRFRTRLTTLLFQGISHARAGDHDAALADFEQTFAACTPNTPYDLTARLRIEWGRSLAARGRVSDAERRLLEAGEILQAHGEAPIFPELRALNEGAVRDLTEALVGLYHDHPHLLDGSAAEHTLLLSERARWAIQRDRGGPRPALEAGALRDLLGRAAGPLAAYFIGRERSFLWVGAPEGVTLHELPPREELGELLRPVLADLATPRRSPDAQALAEVSRVLLSPVCAVWSQGDLLRIVPDDLLFGVPWSGLSCLNEEGETIALRCLDHGPIVEAPALGALASPPVQAASPARRPAALSLLAVGVDGTGSEDGTGAPRLRHAQAEAREVAGLWPPGAATLRAGEQADWAALVAEGLERFDVLHIASHAVVHQGLPMRGALRLAGRDGYAPVTIPEIRGLGLDAELVYLSCCEGAARHAAGSGLMDFARAFMEAGARGVIASTVRVDDEASRDLALAFYRHWLAGMDEARALRAAQRELPAADERWRHPYFWAFIRYVGGGLEPQTPS